MKKLKYLLLVCTTMFLLTGCVKFNANMDIKKDKSMNFSIIYAVNASLIQNQQLLEDKDKKELENKGFTIKEYSKDNMKGFTISRNIKNIDFVSSKDDTEYSLSGILDEKNKDTNIFKVKKGIFKNTYTARFKFDAEDSDLSDTTTDSSNSNQKEDNDDTDDSSFNWDFDSNDSDLSSDMDLSSMMTNMDLSFNVTLPYSSKSNNASTTNNDSKNLSWNLASNKAEMVEFEFELYNMTNIYIGVGVIALLIVILVIFIIKKKRNKNSNIVAQNEMVSFENQPVNIEKQENDIKIVEQPNINQPVDTQTKEHIVDNQSISQDDNKSDNNIDD